MEAFPERHAHLREFCWHEVRHEDKICLFAGQLVRPQQFLQVFHHFNDVLWVEALLLLDAHEAAKQTVGVFGLLDWCYLWKLATQQSNPVWTGLAHFVNM